ncbi:MAG: cysteine dioxygenase family protein [Streptosporangiaceae bacterium]
MSSRTAGTASPGPPAASPGPPAGPSTCPAGLAAAVRRAVAAGEDPRQTADRVARALRRHLPGPEILTPVQLRGAPDRYQTHLLHVEPGGSFSIAAMVWRPGQLTPIHDHVSWCVTGVLQGTEYEEIFTASPAPLPASGPAPGSAPLPASGPAPGGRFLTEVVRRENPPGTVAGFTPPGDIHRVRNSGTGIAVSMHIYGADLSRLGSSIRRVYDLPVRAAAQ